MLRLAPPLKGVRILDISRVLAGPYCSMILGDLGAEVIKVEMPGSGDDTRSFGPPFVQGEAAYFLSLNRSKRSLTLNLRVGEGREVLYRLAEKSDVFLENFRPGVTERLGVDYAAISGVNPGIIYCSISGYGQTGPYREKPAYDLIVQAMSGLMGITGEPDRPPVRVGVAIFDIIAGLYGVISILAALRERDLSGRGQCLDVSLFDASVASLTYAVQIFLATGRDQPKLGSGHQTIVPYQAFPTMDGRYAVVGVGTEAQWRSFCKALGLETMAEDPRFSTNAKRVENRDELVSILTQHLKGWSRERLLKALEEADVPAAPVNLISEVLRDPELQHRGMLLEIPHPKLGKLPQLGPPVKFSKTPLEIELPPPLLGQHTEEILRALLGYSDEEIRRLRDLGAI